MVGSGNLMAFLPSAYEVPGKVMFSVCLFVSLQGDTPSPVTGPVPSPVPGPAGGGYPSQDRTGVYSHRQDEGTPQTGQGVIPRQESKWCYAAGGMPLAVTQEDFLVPKCFCWIHWIQWQFFVKKVYLNLAPQIKTKTESSSVVDLSALPDLTELFILNNSNT